MLLVLLSLFFLYFVCMFLFMFMAWLVARSQYQLWHDLGGLWKYIHKESEKKKFTIEILLMSEYFASNCKWIRHINDLNGTKWKIAADLCWFLEYQLEALWECTELTQILTRCTQWKRDSILFFQLYPFVRAIFIFTYSIAFWYICMSSI